MKVALLLLIPFAAHAGEISVKCTLPKGDAVAGVNYYYGTAAGVYSSTPWNKKSATDCSIVIKNLKGGTTYYVVAKVFDAAGVESPASNEVTRVATLGAPVLE
jgi:hypothetical protein